MTALQMTQRTVDIPVEGGSLHGALWNENAAGDPVLAIHGITANHTSFYRFAEMLGAPVLALDLRGRGKSRELPGPFVLEQHARDMAKALQHTGWERTRVVGHSMGAFVGVRLAAAHPELVGSLVLIDGGIPLRTDETKSASDVLGPAIERLSMKFVSAEAYRDFWRQHPAFGPYWNSQIERYVDYDLVEVGDALQPTANPEAVAANMLELDGREGYIGALASLTLPFTLFASPRGLFDEEPGLYDREWITTWNAKLPAMTVHAMPDTNHYTVLLSDAVKAVADELKGES